MKNTARSNLYSDKVSVCAVFEIPETREENEYTYKCEICFIFRKVHTKQAGAHLYLRVLPWMQKS